MYEAVVQKYHLSRRMSQIWITIKLHCYHNKIMSILFLANILGLKLASCIRYRRILSVQIYKEVVKMSYSSNRMCQMGHSPEMSSTPKNPKIGIRTPFLAIYLHQMVQYVVCTCSSYLALSEYVSYKWIALIFLSLLRF